MNGFEPLSFFSCQQNIYRFCNNGENIIIKIEIKNLGKFEPFGTIKSSFFFKHYLCIWRLRQEISYSFSFFADFRIRRDILVLAKFLLDVYVETELHFYFQIGRASCRERV